MNDDLNAFVREQLDDEERLAHAVLGADASSWDPYGYLPGEKRDYLALYSPARVLAEVDAKRRILDVYQADVIDVSRRGGPPEWMHGAVPVEAHTVLRLLTLPYADRPGYRDEWKP